MKINKKQVSQKTGMPPGTLVHIGEKKTETIQITLIDYDSENYEEKKVLNIEDCFGYKSTPTVTWINIDGLHQVEIIEKTGKHFGLHPLTLEDILNTKQRPKCEDYEQYLFTVLNMLKYNNSDNLIESEQISMILGDNFVISFQEVPGDVFDPIRERLRKRKGKIRDMPSDYLFHSLFDIIIDNYFIILEKIGEKIEVLEESLINPSGEAVQQIHYLKRELINMRKSVWPIREMINILEKNGSSLIRESTRPYFRDVYDHTIQVIDTIESSRDMVSGMLDIYLSSVSNRMNSVMKVLTIIATLFIPLTFIAGIYGMNFKYMPELEWKFGYLLVWIVMILITIIMLVYFKRKKWL